MTNRTPPNCIFEVDDFESNWLYRKPFDYIHGRELEGCIANPDQLFQQAFQHLNSGGYLELQAVDGYFLSDDGTAQMATNAQRWIQSMLEGARKFGKPLDQAAEWKEKMENAGFVDVEQKVHKVSRSWILVKFWSFSISSMLITHSSSQLDHGLKTLK